MKKKLATNIVITGEAGIGKSYLCTDIVRVYEGVGRTFIDIDLWNVRHHAPIDNFSIDQVVYTFPEYMDLIVKLPMGKPIVFDEPSYAMGKRDWYKEINKVLVQTMESQRFMIHPVFIPIINKSLLDKTIRSYLIQFQVHVNDRGRATVYRISPSQSSDKVYRWTVCELYYRLFDNDICTTDSCIGCPELQRTERPCPLFRAQYERKKSSVQLVRYAQAKEDASKKESAKMTDEQLCDKLWPLHDSFRNERGRIDFQIARIVAHEQLGLELTGSKMQVIVKLMRYKYPEEF